MSAPAVDATGWVAPTGAGERTIVLLHPRSRRAARHMRTMGTHLLRGGSGHLDGDNLTLRADDGQVVADLPLNTRMARAVRAHGAVLVIIGAGPLVGGPTAAALQRYRSSIGFVSRGQVPVVVP